MKNEKFFEKVDKDFSEVEGSELYNEYAKLIDSLKGKDRGYVCSRLGG